MRKAIIAVTVMLLLLAMNIGCVGENYDGANDYTDPSDEHPLSDNTSVVTHDYLRKAPSLNVSFIADGSPVQDIPALQLTTSWLYVDRDGNGSGYEADSPHPLQISDYSEATLNLGGMSGEIVLQFSDNYPPQSISAQRWDASFATGSQNIDDVIDKGETVGINDNTINFSDDGHSYIYAVYAKWSEGSSTGSSYYAFRTESTPSWTPLSELPADYSIEQAVQDGVYVHGMEIFNQELVDIFHEDVCAGNAAFMRVMQHTIEGDAIITDYQYDSDIFTVHNDTTRDKFGSQGITTMTFKHLVRLDWDSPVYFSEPYYLLSNEEDVFTIAENGAKTKFIDGVFWVPTPPSEWGLKIGSVTIVSDGITYEPYVHFMYSKTRGLFADGVDFHPTEVSQELQIIECGDDFEVIIDGDDLSSFSYTLYNLTAAGDWYSDGYDSSWDFRLPSESGEYLLCVDVIWSNNETDTELHEYTGNRYVFKIRV